MNKIGMRHMDQNGRRQWNQIDRNERDGRGMTGMRRKSTSQTTTLKETNELDRQETDKVNPASNFAAKFPPENLFTNYPGQPIILVP